MRLLTTLWGFESLTTTRAVDHRGAELRRVLGDDAAHPRFVETVRSTGYGTVALRSREGGGAVIELRLPPTLPMDPPGVGMPPSGPR